MAIITSAGLTDLYNQRTFNKNGSTVTLKKISDTEWMLIGDLAEGDSEGFGGSIRTLNILEHMYFQPTSESDPIGYNEFTSRGGSVSIDITHQNQLDPFNFDEQITVHFPEEDYLWVGVFLPANFSGERFIRSGAKELEFLQQITLNRDYQFRFDSQNAGSGFSEHVLPIGQQTVELVDIGYFYSIDSPSCLLYKKADGTSFQHSLNEFLRFRLSVSEGGGSPVFSNPWFMVYSDQLGQGVLFNGDDGIEGIELSTQVGTTRSVFFRPQDGVGLPPDPDQWFLRFNLRDDNGDYPGNNMVVRYGDGTERTYQVSSSFNFSEVVSMGGVVEIEIELHRSGTSITGDLYYLAWSAPF